MRAIRVHVRTDADRDAIEECKPLVGEKTASRTPMTAARSLSALQRDLDEVARERDSLKESLRRHPGL